MMEHGREFGVATRVPNLHFGYFKHIDANGGCNEERGRQTIKKIEVISFANPGVT